MKKISTLLVSSLFSLSLLAYDGSGLSISTINTSSKFKVEVDGHNVFMQGNSVTLDYLNVGYHSVRIYREAKRKNFYNDYGRRDDGDDRRDERYDRRDGADNFRNERYGSRDEIIYSTSIYLSKDSHTDIIISKSGKVFVDSYRVGPENDWYNNNDGTCQEGGDNTNGGGWNNGYGNVMNTRDFQMAKESISKEWFENNRLTLAKTIMDKNNFTTQQVKDMMLLFTFENNRLEVAKYAYSKTVDKQNYYQLNDALTFSSTKEELARFIRESR